MTTRTVHMCLDIRGALNWSDELIDRLGCTRDGEPLTPDEVRNVLRQALYDGWKVYPLCDCEGFDPQTGCPGKGAA